MRSMSAAFAVVALAGVACGQPLYSVSFNGQLHTLNTATGAATLVAASGFDRLNSAAMGPDGQIYSNHARNAAVPTDTNKLIRIDPATGAGALVADWGTINDMRGMAFFGATLYAILEGSPDSLVTIDTVSGAVTLVGPTSRSDLQGLASTPSGDLYACGVLAPAGSIYKIDRTSGATVAASGIVGNDNQALEFASGTVLFAARANLVTVDYVTGVVTNLGPTGLTDIRGMARALSVGCYANCDGSTAAPVLNVNDFTCFLNRYAANESYANCDASTAPPVLNVNDFTCFLNQYAAGCP